MLTQHNPLSKLDATLIDSVFVETLDWKPALVRRC